MNAKSDRDAARAPAVTKGQPPERGRHRQRGRTRASIVAAAMKLLKSRSDPSVAEIAHAAEVSRRTVYLYFPTLEHLLLDAKLGLLSESAVDKAIEAADRGGDVEARVDAMIRALGTLTDQSLPLGRSLIRLTIDRPAAGDSSAPRRGYRRVSWIEKAVAPLRDRLGKRAFENLISALAVVVGWEALVVLQDVRGLSSDERLKTMQWTARAIIRAALDDASTKPLRKPKSN